jgi:hypothetical protein
LPLSFYGSTIYGNLTIRHNSSDKKPCITYICRYTLVCSTFVFFSFANLRIFYFSEQLDIFYNGDHIWTIPSKWSLVQISRIFLSDFLLKFSLFLKLAKKKKKLKCVVDGKTVNGKPQNIYVRASYHASLNKDGCLACDCMVLGFVSTYHY